MKKLYIIILSMITFNICAQAPQPMPGVNKTHVTITCNDGYTQEWEAQGTTLIECTTSPDVACCDGLIKQAVCASHNGVNPPINPPACTNPEQIKNVMNSLSGKVSPQVMAQIRSMLMQKQNGIKPK